MGSWNAQRQARLGVRDLVRSLMGKDETPLRESSKGSAVCSVPRDIIREKSDGTWVGCSSHCQFLPATDARRFSDPAAAPFRFRHVYRCDDCKCRRFTVPGFSHCP